MYFKLFLLIFVVGVCAAANISKLTSSEVDYLENVFKNIPKNERRKVLFHHLFLGYINDNPQLKPSNYNLSPSDTKKIYNIFLAKFKLNSKSYTLCFASGECIDPSDSGIYPS